MCEVIYLSEAFSTEEISRVIPLTSFQSKVNEAPIGLLSYSTDSYLLLFPFFFFSNC